MLLLQLIGEKMDTKKIIAILAVALIAFAGVGAYYLLQDDDDADLKVSYLKKSAYETHIIADQKGIFSNNGVNVESVPVSGSGSDSVNMLMTGVVDIAATGEGPVASAIKEYGDDIVVLCGTNRYTGGQVWVASPEMTGNRALVKFEGNNEASVKASFESAADTLDGTILVGVQRSSTTESELKSWLKAMEISFNDFGETANKTVTLKDIKANQLVSTMDAGEIHIMAASQPYPDKAIDSITGSYVIGSNADIDSYGLSVYITTKDIYIEKNAEIKRFVSALKDATDYMVDPDNYEECTETCAEVCGTSVSTFESAWSISEFQIGWTDKMADVLHNTCKKKGVDVTLEFCKSLCPSELKDHMDSL